jgi:hypothetical protein
MTANTPAASCTLTKEGTLTVVPVKRKFTVTYEFNTNASNADLALRYLVLVNGNVIQANGGRPRALDGRNRKIVVAVDPGSKVALILNSDVHPNFRRNPVYAVQVNDCDARVIITERRGRLGHESSTLRLSTPRTCPETGARIDEYQAALTGDVWMAISTLYTEAEADAMLPADIDPIVRFAVRRIYRGLQTNELLVQFPASEAGPAFIMSVKFDTPNNVLENTTHCDPLSGVLPRTHPCAYAALLAEASMCRITAMRVTSGWRPMLGSIIHRAGLGLDINYAERGSQHVTINRTSLTDVRGRRNENVSAREQELYAEYERAKEDYEAKKRAVNAARNGEEKNAADKQAKEADKIQEAAKDAWNKERNQHEPELIRSLREGLSHNSSISQILDPWYIDINTRSHAAPVPNEYRSSNEKLHGNHLHITVSDPQII